MKKIIFLVFAFVVTFNSFSQNAEQEIRKVVTEYLGYVETGDFLKTAEYMPDGYFDVFSKEEYLKTFEVFIDEKIKVADSKVIKVDKIKKIKDKYYSIVTFSFLMKYKMNIEEVNKEGIEIDGKNYDMIDFMLIACEKIFGKGNVKYNKETNFFEKMSIANIVVISNNGITDWKLVEDREKALLGKFVPKKILKAAFKN